MCIHLKKARKIIEHFIRNLLNLSISEIIIHLYEMNNLLIDSKKSLVVNIPHQICSCRESRNYGYAHVGINASYKDIRKISVPRSHSSRRGQLMIFLF